MSESEVYEHSGRQFRRNPDNPAEWQTCDSDSDGWYTLSDSGPSVALLNDFYPRPVTVTLETEVGQRTLERREDGWHWQGSLYFSAECTSSSALDRIVELGGADQ